MYLFAHIRVTSSIKRRRLVLAVLGRTIFEILDLRFGRPKAVGSRSVLALVELGQILYSGMQIHSAILGEKISKNLNLGCG